MRSALFGVFAFVAAVAVAVPAQAATSRARHHHKPVRHVRAHKAARTDSALAGTKAAAKPAPSPSDAAPQKPVARPDTDGLQSDFDRVGNG